MQYFIDLNAIVELYIVSQLKNILKLVNPNKWNKYIWNKISLDIWCGIHICGCPHTITVAKHWQDV